MASFAERTLQTDVRNCKNSVCSSRLEVFKVGNNSTALPPPIDVPSSCTNVIERELVHGQSESVLSLVVEDETRSISEGAPLNVSEKGSDGGGGDDRRRMVMLALGSSSEKDIRGIGGMGAIGGNGQLITGGDSTCPKNAEK